MEYLDIETLKYERPCQGEMAMAMPRRPCARHWYGISDTVSFVLQCTPDGRHTRPVFVPEHYAVCCRVI